ncbi:cytochrome P450 2K6-like [Pelobates cultripes]|uniref:Cytochrome P450 2K6-like n=1 Tax=Pelobates cultripes TaxID=61616 RepID=A0AAD1VRH3_PELCU|nr:cytochrome P450 2K6-like [Pelobates cultripes]
MAAVDIIYSITLALMSVVTILFLYNVLSGWTSMNKRFPPGPRPLPLIGNLHMLNLRKPYLTYLELSKIYGPVFSVQVGMRKSVILVGYESIKDALVNFADEFAERAYMPIFEKIDKGKGVIFSHGENWKVMRRFAIMTLRDFGMGKKTIEDKIIEESGFLNQRIEAFNGQPFDNIMILNASVANIIVGILLGRRMDFEDKTFQRLLFLLTENVLLLGTSGVAIYNMYPIFGIFPGSHKEFFRNVEELYAFLKKTFVEHMTHLDREDQRSFIDAFLVRQKEEADNPESYFDNHNLTTLVRNLFAAGMETTATTIRWGLLMMIKYPKIQEKVQEEISQTIGLAQPNYSHHGQMPYTNAVIHEIQRCGDILPMTVAHETTKDVNFRGYFLPKGTPVIPIITSVLNDKTQYPYPDKFNPNNFLDSEGNFVKTDAFMPFGAGRRVCVGETLAKMELFIFFTSLLQKFTFHLPPGTSDVNLNSLGGFTNAPPPQMICAVPRY